MPEALLSLLEAGGDVGIWVLVFIMWKFDRRIMMVELTLDRHLIDENKVSAKLLAAVEGKKNGTY